MSIQEKDRILSATGVLQAERPDGTWAKKFNLGIWLASGSMAQPCESALYEAEDALIYLQEAARETEPLVSFHEKVLELAKYYRNRFHQAINVVFGNISEESIVFEDNGRSAIFAAVQLCHPKAVLTTSEEPGQITLPLRGDDPWAIIPPDANYYPAHDFFAPRRRVRGETYPHEKIQVNVVEVETIRQKTDEEIIADFVSQYRESLTTSNPIEFVLIPHVTRIGRLLPIRKIAKTLREIAEEHGRELIICIDGVQAVGRTYAEELVNPFDYCDIYLYNSTKGVAAQLTSSCLLVKPSLLRSRISSLLENPVYNRYIRYGQFSESVVSNEIVNKLCGEEFYCVGLTELAGFIGGLEAYIFRGPTSRQEVQELGLIEEVDLLDDAMLTGAEYKAYSNRRRFVMADMRRQRQELIEMFKRIGIEVFDPKDISSVPHLLLIKIPGIRSHIIRKILQSQDHPVTTSQPEGEWLRIGIPEDPYINSQEILYFFIAPLLRMMHDSSLVPINEALGQICLYYDPYEGEWKIAIVKPDLIEFLGSEAKVWLGTLDELKSNATIMAQLGLDK